MYSVFDLLSLKPFFQQSQTPQFQLLVNPHPTLIHQNYTIRKEHAPSDTILYVACDLIHHQSKKIRTQSQTLMQSYII
jgi:hypothetical protein